MAKKRTGHRTSGNPAAAARVRVQEDVVIALSPYGDPLEELAGLVEERRELDAMISDLVSAARSRGTTWAALAGVFGLTRQAVTKRYAGSTTERQQ